MTLGDISAFSDLEKTIWNQDAGNMLLLPVKPFVCIYEGSVVDSKTGSGTTANNVMTYSFAIRAQAVGVTEISRIELEIDADGTGADLNVQIRDSTFNPDGSSLGTLLKTMTVPKEFLPTTAGYWSIPLDLTGLTAGSYVWIIISKAGDSTNHFHLRSEASQDAAHPCYRRSESSGAWTANNAIHYRAYSGDTGLMVHCNEGANMWTTCTFTDGIPTGYYCYCPTALGVDSGIRKKITITNTGGAPKRGV